MTKQEAITIIGNLEDKDILFNPCDVQDAKTMAIKVLEQEPTIGQLFSCEEVEELRKKIWKQVEQEPKTDVLDKIRAEIDAQIDLHDTPFEIDDGMDSSFCDGLNKAKEIIDKYMKGE